MDWIVASVVGVVVIGLIVYGVRLAMQDPFDEDED